MFSVQPCLGAPTIQRGLLAAWGDLHVSAKSVSCLWIGFRRMASACLVFRMLWRLSQQRVLHDRLFIALCPRLVLFFVCTCACRLQRVSKHLCLQLGVRSMCWRLHALPLAVSAIPKLYSFAL